MEIKQTPEHNLVPLCPSCEGWKTQVTALTADVIDQKNKQSTLAEAVARLEGENHNRYLERGELVQKIDALQSQVADLREALDSARSLCLNYSDDRRDKVLDEIDAALAKTGPKS